MVHTGNKDFMKKLEEFPIDENVIQEFINRNNKNWEEKENNGYIYINFSMVRMQTAWIVPKLLYAKGLEEVSGAKPIVITWRENELLSKFFSSFKIEHIAIEELNRKNLLGLIKAGFCVLGILLKGGDGNTIKNLQMDGRNIGYNLYEDILRTSSLSTLKSCRNKIALKKILHILWSYDSLKKQCKKLPIRYAVTDDMAYHEGVFIKLFSSLGAEIYECNNYVTTKVEFDDQDNIKRFPLILRNQFVKEMDTLDDSTISWTDNYLKERFQGKNGRAIDRIAFADKKVLSGIEITKELGIDSSKKNVVIMAHTFTDAVYNYGTYYFRDYYDWVEKTLQFASEITNVNWILKPHPTRRSYNETEDSIEAMFERNKKPHMHILSDDISGETIKEFADVILTIGGNAGLEFSCLGIPSIIVGKPLYSGWGITIEPATLEEYRNTLKNADQIQRLNDDQIKTAKKLFYLQNSNGYYGKLSYHDYFSDSLNQEYQKMINKMAHQYFKNNEGTEEYNTNILKWIMSYMDEHSLKDTIYYQKGKSI